MMLIVIILLVYDTTYSSPLNWSETQSETWEYDKRVNFEQNQEGERKAWNQTQTSRSGWNDRRIEAKGIVRAWNLIYGMKPLSLY